MTSTLNYRENEHQDSAFKAFKSQIHNQPKPDLFNSWIDVYVTTNPKSEVGLASLYRHYKEFVISIEFIPLGKINFSNLIREQFKKEIYRGQIIIHSNSKVKYEGLELQLKVDLQKHINKI